MLFFSVLQNVGFVLQTIHKLYIKPYIEPYTASVSNPTLRAFKPYTASVQNPTLRRSKTYTEPSTEPHVEV